MTEVTDKQLAKWTRRCNGHAVWDTDDADSYMGICYGINKTCKDKDSCIGHYGVPYPDVCPICKTDDYLEMCGL